MALYPKIQSPCPYKNNLAGIMDGDVCRACKRQVFDLSNMSDDQRVAFIRGCKDDVCVSYRIRPAIAAAAIAAAIVAVPTAAAACSDATQEETVFVGGIKDPAHVTFVENPGDKAIPELPVIYENAAPATEKSKTAPDKQAPVNSRA